MNIVVNEDLKAYIDPLTADEYASLEQSILAEGCRDALVLWGEMLIDGHNRYGICQKHGLPFNTVQNTRFKSMDDVHLWMIDQHLGRRSVSDFQRGVLALRRRDILLERTRSTPPADSLPGVEPGDDGAPPWDVGDSANTMPPTREELARAAKLSNAQVAAIEKIQRQAAPEVIAAVRAGELSINAAAVVATLSPQEQQAAAQGGVQELKDTVKRVRDAKKRLRPERPAEAAAHAAAPAEETLPQLRMRLDQLQQEVARLKTRVAEMEAAEKPAW